MTITLTGLLTKGGCRGQRESDGSGRASASRAGRGARSAVWRSSGCREAGGSRCAGAGRAADRRAASETALKGRDARLMALQRPAVGSAVRSRFRLEMDGWERPPAQTSLLLGVHSGSVAFPFPPAGGESDLRRRPEAMNPASASPVRSSSNHTRRQC